MQKAYVRQNFVNGTDPALDEVDMNKIDSGLSEVDDRVILLDGSKADKTQVFACVNSIIYTISTGILRITYVSGAVQDVNLGLNNVALSMSPLGVITMQDSEGNTYTCDLREIINSDLAELGDVNITDPEDGQVLKYNAETGKWENGEGGLGSAVSYEAQTLTDSQKAQARENIDAASVEELSHENLLDNPFFTVNQRGITSWTTAPSYIMDRWRVLNSSDDNTATLDNGVLTLTRNTGFNGVFQILGAGLSSKLTGKMCTASVLLSDGTIISGSSIFSAPCTFVADVDDTTCLLDVDTASNLRFAIDYKSSISIKAIKLEVGAVSTLANDVPRPYAEELARCQTSTAYSGDTYTNKGNLVTSKSIAPTEDGATASKAYAVGEHFFRGGDYCTCIQAIANGGSFTLNTNYKVEPLSNPIEYITKGSINIPLKIANDLNSIGGDYTFNVSRWETSSAHTPYTESVTIYGSGIVISYQIPVGGGYYSVQMSLVVGENKMFIRSRAGGSWTSWTAIQ